MGGTEKDGEYELLEPCLLWTYTTVTVFEAVMVLRHAATLIECANVILRIFCVISGFSRGVNEI